MEARGEALIAGEAELLLDGFCERVGSGEVGALRLTAGEREGDALAVPCAEGSPLALWGGEAVGVAHATGEAVPRRGVALPLRLAEGAPEAVPGTSEGEEPAEGEGCPVAVSAGERLSVGVDAGDAEARGLPEEEGGSEGDVESRAERLCEGVHVAVSVAREKSAVRVMVASAVADASVEALPKLLAVVATLLLGLSERLLLPLSAPEWEGAGEREGE
jgi:hypothetical protein